jgi:hypothetical protein
MDDRGTLKLSFALKRVSFDFEERVATNESVYFVEDSYDVLFPVLNSI